MPDHLHIRIVDDQPAGPIIKPESLYTIQNKVITINGRRHRPLQQVFDTQPKSIRKHLSIFCPGSLFLGGASIASIGQSIVSGIDL